DSFDDLLPRGGQGKAEGERGAMALTALEPHSPTVANDELTREVEADTHAGGVAIGRTGMGAEEALEDAVLPLGGNAHPVIADGDDRLVALTTHLDLDPPAVGGVLDGVVEQVR